ncbi:MAG: hypothetical protein FJX54_00820 [Alphaproteobacteria bacterium]|nr:hypothetical protein [Alphaproteobacteria bacterium]
MTIASWLLVGGLTAALATSAFGLGWAFRDGSLPAFAYAFQDEATSPATERAERMAADAFDGRYSELVDWRKLQALAGSIEKYRPDGLEDPYRIAASLLAQVRATRGTASFLAGEDEISLRVTASPGSFDFQWDQRPSIIRRIARDAGHASLSERELRIVNSNLNWAQFSYLDDAMRRAVVYRQMNGNLGLLIRE